MRWEMLSKGEAGSQNSVCFQETRERVPKTHAVFMHVPPGDILVQLNQEEGGLKRHHLEKTPLQGPGGPLIEALC